ncbi:MAG TPA: GPW/gp25 family protein [Actinomycetota bacterium]|nr:GPW/gp25 family protein [Actinomycetota bacterium]
MNDQFVGRGWAFPLRTDSTGGMALVSREREIEEAVRVVLMTAPGERPMRPEFGCRIHDFIFAPADATTAGRISYEVRRALRRWEPRIDVNEVSVLFDTEDPSLLYVDVRYTIKSTNDPRNLVFPFYVIPGEGNETAREAELVSTEE